MGVPFWRVMDANGDGTGVSNMNVNGAVTPQTFHIHARTGERTLVITELTIKIEDNANFDSGGYGAINPPGLANGIKIEHVKHNLQTNQDGPVITDLMDGLTVKQNSHWARHCQGAQLLSFGTGNSVMTAHWAIYRAHAPLVIDHDEALRCTIQDDLTALVAHRITCAGYVD